MPTIELETKKKKVYVRETKTSLTQSTSPIAPPEGFMTGDEFERRVKERVTKFYQENGLL
jgi:hypothetical protein